ncbi:bifunctional UDP-sugar hydrolase/5'-nucleotidase [Bacillus sp. FJAT-47783]|uniref:bifunctional metallophosphatase/5'-nucleotidase n=1 Tax=Bacillus sp. FJAT-47783 TaxID=2922712 RepID=UPI001FACEEE8|nr:bifunctional UDP-sugar hydrolase/5'-nucleotidase [Bacillus sp. FJAT-47783]
MRITILETSDIHGHMFPYLADKSDRIKQGISYIYRYVQQSRKEEEHVLLIDNGDVIQGSPFMLYHVKNESDHPNPIIQLLNETRYDAAVVGNHEFNFGLDFFKKAMSESKFPWLSCNILDEKTNEPTFGQPYIIKKFGEIKVVVLGATTHFIPNWEDPHHIEGLLFEDAVQSLKKWVPSIQQAEKPDLFIVSYHGGFERDIHTGEAIEEETGENQAYKICQEINGIDILLTGHQHQQMASQINGVHIIQPGFNGQGIGKVTVEFTKRNNRWEVEEMNSQVVQWDDVTPDESILQSVRPFEERTHKWLDKIIARSNGGLEIHDTFQARLKEHPYVEFINKIQMHATGAPISCTALFNNAAKGFSQSITIRDVVTNYIYPNTLKVLEVTGEDIKEALERCATYFDLRNDEIIVNRQFSEPKPQHFNYDMWEGIDYTIDLTQKTGNRVISVTYNGEPLQKDHLYHVVMNNYRASGGGGYTMFQNKRVVIEMQRDMTELIIEYLEQNKWIEATVNENWRILKG